MIYIMYRQLSEDAPAYEQANWFLDSVREAYCETYKEVIEYSNTQYVLDTLDPGDVVYFRNIGSQLNNARRIIQRAALRGAHVIDPYLLWQYRNGESIGPRSKTVMHQALSDAGISVPSTEFITLDDFIDSDNYHGIIKTARGGRQGNGTYVYLEDDQQRKQEIVDDILSKPRMGRDGLLVQEYIPNRGDIRVVTVGCRVVAVMKRKSKSTDQLKFNTSNGKSKSIRHPRRDVIELAERASREMGIHVASMDIIRDRRNGALYIVDLNESPTVRIIHVRTKVNIPQLVVDYLNEVANS
jgi:glutathione synthase/RimK-type ligase-like ATP-grasp enzyme